MKITFSNLGAIKKTTLDLRPLTVIIGPNNSNKTYIAYSIYGLWKTFNEVSNYIFRELFRFVDNDEHTVSIKTEESFYNSFQNICNLAVKEFSREIETFFQDSTHKIFNRTKFEVEVSRKEIGVVLNQLSRGKNFSFRMVNTKVHYKNNILRIKVIGSEKHLRPVSDVLANLALKILINGLFSNTLLLPAERNAFIITYKMLANRRYKYLRQTQRELFSHRTEERQLELLKEQGDIRYPQPIEDFLDFLTDVELETNIENDFSENKGFYEIANKIEGSIQNTNRTSFQSTKLGGNEIKVNVSKGLDIDLYNASSSIKQLAPLLLYLRYRAKEGDLLIIDEPEMNLHPESQAKLLEVLAMLVNAGVNVLLTTHSPYFMSHLNNLISGDMNNENVREKQATSLYLEDSRAFLKPEDVSAYEMKNNKLVSLKHKDEDGDYSISWETLSDVSADIQQKFFEMYEKRETTSSGEEKE